MYMYYVYIYIYIIPFLFRCLFADEVSNFIGQGRVHLYSYII